MHARVGGGMAVLMMALASAGPVAAAELTLDKGKTQLLIRVHKEGVAARLAHNHVIAAKDFTSTVSYDPEKPEATSIKVEVQVKTLVVDDPTLKKRWNEDAPSESDRADITKNMLADDQLNAAKFPTVTFASTSVTKNEDGSLAVKGNLTLHGVTKPVSFTTKVEADGAGYKAKAEIPIKASDYGFKPFSAMFGAIKNKDDMQFILELVAVPK